MTSCCHMKAASQPHILRASRSAKQSSCSSWGCRMWTPTTPEVCIQGLIENRAGGGVDAGFCFGSFLCMLRHAAGSLDSGIKQYFCVPYLIQLKERGHYL
jgi:hypothetical protein